MKTLLKLLLCILLAFSTIVCKAQKNSLYGVISKSINFKEGTFLSDTYNSRAFFFSIGISVDKNGAIDSIYFSNSSILYLNQLVDFDGIKKALKANKSLFQKNKGEYLVQMVFIRRGENNKINNADEMETSWTEMTDQIVRAEKTKKIIMLTPMHYRIGSRLIVN